MKIEIEIDDDEARTLRGLAKHAPAMGGEVINGMERDVVEWLVHCAAEGIRRPGAWERGWLCSAFGDVDEHLETTDDFGHERFRDDG